MFQFFQTSGQKEKLLLAQHLCKFCVELVFAIITVGLVNIDFIKWWKLISSLSVCTFSISIVQQNCVSLFLLEIRLAETCFCNILALYNLFLDVLGVG